MIDDPFAGTTNSLISPALDCFEITPDDSSDLTTATKAIYIGIGGDIVLRAVGSDSDVTLRNTIGGSIIDVRVRAIRSTGTTATDIVGLA
ncbi:MAG: spike base protein, RCAP_Rcc01079 family [Erythrobacter sp.]